MNNLIDLGHTTETNYRMWQNHKWVEGEWSPSKQWEIDFVEHVKFQYVNNFLDTFKQGRVIVITHALPKQGGYHHVNERPDEYWIEKIEALGYKLSDRNDYYRGLAHDYFAKSGLVFLKRV